jgi:uncharacterized protein DUF1835
MQVIDSANRMSLNLHIAPSASAGGLIKQALDLPSAELLDNGDSLSCGPLLPLSGLNEWIRIREEYARTLYPEFEFTFAEYRRDLLSQTEIVRNVDSITVWAGTGLAEQLLLVWIPQFLRLLDVDPEKLRIIQFSTVANNLPEIQSIGILNPNRLKDHPPAKPLDKDSLALLDTAWAAVTANEPWSLVEFLTDDASSLPFLKRSLRWLLYRFPDVESGLSALQMQLLAMVEERGPEAARVIGYTMSRTIDWLDWVGDAQLFAWLKRLGAPSLKYPLVSLIGNPLNMREMEVRITDIGKRVLAQEHNFVVLNGIDEWVGGMHLDSAADRIWFQRNGVIVADYQLRPV